MKTLWNMLVNALMRPLLIEVVGISGDDAMQLMLVENEEVVGTLTLKRTHESFAQGIGSRGFGWGVDGFDARALEQTLELETKLAIVVMNEVFRPFAPRGGFANLLMSIHMLGWW
jgi:hypothetical protein